MNLRSLPLLAAGALLAFGCGGEDEGRPPKASACRPIEPLSDFPDLGGNAPDCGALAGVELFFVSTFERGETSPGWYTSNDGTALQDPPANTDPIPPVEIPGGRCVGASPGADVPTVCDSPDQLPGSCTEPANLASRSAIHIRTGFMSNNGGTLGRPLPKRCEEDAPICPFTPGPPEIGPCSIGQSPTPGRQGCEAANDFSGWEGIVFWGRVARGSTPTVRVRASDVRTDDKGCVCNPFTNQNDSSDGCDKFSRSVTLDETWRVYFVPFAEMQQGGWGLKSPGLDTKNLFEIAFEYRHGAWDLWIDDVAFYRRKR